MVSETKDEFVYGLNPVSEALRSQRRAFELFVAAGTEKRFQQIIKAAEEKGVPVRRRDKNDLSRLAGTEHHQGVLLRVEVFVYAGLEDIIYSWRNTGEPGLLLVLDGIQDPHNLGALIRSAACAGAHGVIIPKDRAVGVTPAVEKASAGAVAIIPVARVVNISQTLSRLKEEGFWIYGSAGDASTSLYHQDLKGNVAIVIGSEGEGIRPLVRKQCDVIVSIPLRGRVNSLNASVAGGILLFEAVRQRLTNQSS